LIVEAKVGWLESSSSKAKAHEEAAEVVRVALGKLPEVTDVIWLSKDEFEQA
jgi:hypothetical protein